MGKLCRRRMLLAGLTLLCLLLPIFLAPAAQTALSNGVSFSGITLAVTAPEGDNVPQMLEQVMSKMNDISQYCAFAAMEAEEAREALENGSVTAILELPGDFVQGVLSGENPDVTLIVPENRPLEALLTLWVGQSASDLLASFQNGIYAVLELYQLDPPEGVSYEDVVAGINLRYINWTMNRQDMFRFRTVSATQQLPIDLHYGLSILSYLLLSLAPLFTSVYQRDWLEAQRRFRAAGRGWTGGFFCTMAACTALLIPIALIPQLMLVKGAFLPSLGAAVLSAVFCASFGSLCCLLSDDTGICGGLSFGCSLVFLVLSGGIVPPVMLPAALRSLMAYSPVTWLRNAAVLSGGTYEPDYGAITALIAASAGLILLCGLLYHRRCRQVEVSR